jgi:hypothetical protein
MIRGAKQSFSASVFDVGEHAAALSDRSGSSAGDGAMAIAAAEDGNT